MKRLLSKKYAAIGFATLLFGIFWLPKDIEDAGDAAEVWQRWLAMLDQNTALWAFSFVALAYIAWMDARPFLRSWISDRKKGKPSQFESEAQRLIVTFTEKAFIPAKNQLSHLTTGISAEYERNRKGDITAQFLRGASVKMSRVLDHWSFNMREPTKVVEMDIQELGRMATTLVGNYYESSHRTIEFIKFVLLQNYLPPEFVLEKIEKFLVSHETLIEHFNDISTKGYFDSLLRGAAERQLKELTEIKDSFFRIIAKYQP